MPVSMTGKIAYVEVITPPAIRGPAGPRYFCLAREAIETRPIGVARTRLHRFLTPGARIAQRVVFGSDYEDGQRVHSSAPSSACACTRPPVRVFQTARQGFKVPRTRSEPFPNAAEIGRKIEFLTVDAGFGPS